MPFSSQMRRILISSYPIFQRQRKPLRFVFSISPMISWLTQLQKLTKEGSKSVSSQMMNAWSNKAQMSSGSLSREFQSALTTMSKPICTINSLSLMIHIWLMDHLTGLSRLEEATKKTFSSWTTHTTLKSIIKNSNLFGYNSPKTLWKQEAHLKKSTKRFNIMLPPKFSNNGVEKKLLENNDVSLNTWILTFSLITIHNSNHFNVL